MKCVAQPPVHVPRAFTLIELLIVVAIIAILAAIAVPNFLEAQTRAKVSRAKADLRTLATAIEMYTVDHHVPPIDGTKAGDLQANEFPPTTLTSPVAYLTSVPADPFQGGSTPVAHPPGSDEALFPPSWYLGYRYVNTRYRFNTPPSLIGGQRLQAYSERLGSWWLYSIGPDRNFGPTVLAPVGLTTIEYPLPYDPSNGTVSTGDIVRSQSGQ